MLATSLVILLKSGPFGIWFFFIGLNFFWIFEESALLFFSDFLRAYLSVSLAICFELFSNGDWFKFSLETLGDV